MKNDVSNILTQCLVLREVICIIYYLVEYTGSPDKHVDDHNILSYTCSRTKYRYGVTLRGLLTHKRSLKMILSGQD